MGQDDARIRSSEVCPATRYTVFRMVKSIVPVITLFRGVSELIGKAPVTRVINYRNRFSIDIGDVARLDARTTEDFIVSRGSDEEVPSHSMNII